MKKKLFSLLILMLISSIMLTTAGCQSEEWVTDPKNKKTTVDLPATEPINIGLIADAHVITAAERMQEDSSIFEHYMKYYRIKRMLNLSEAILSTAVDELLVEDLDAVFVIGDLTEFGTTTSLQAVATELKRLKNAGIPTYVINGYSD